MKRIRQSAILIGCLSLSLMQAPIYADTMDQLNQQEAQLQQRSEQISTQIQNTLSDVNDKYAQVEDLKKQIADNQQLLEKTQKDITDTQEIIAKRKEVVAKRLQSIQVNHAADIDLKTLFASKNIGEFIQRIYAMTLIQNFENEKFTSLNQAVDTLEDLNNKATQTQNKLQKDKAELDVQVQQLDTKMANLRQQLADNKDALAKIAADKEVENQRIAAEKARQEREAKEAAKQAQQSQTTTTNQSQSQTQVVTPSQPTTSTPDTSTSTGGRVMTMESTAYSYSEAGASYFTASGTDLRANPMAIAVDPSVIPLGTLLEVQGYGVALALDTGGAIKGNIIDVHFPTVAQCKVWGRRMVQVRILS
nr:3D domain-containing protein [Enterococcus cecorum]